MIGVGAFWLSFTALADLAERAGTPAELAWVWPLIVDGVIVIATISVVALSGHGRRATRYPWSLLTGAALVSVSANITHALVAADPTVPPTLAGLVAAIPPMVLLAITHLTVELTRYQRTTSPTPPGPEQTQTAGGSATRAAGHDGRELARRGHAAPRGIPARTSDENTRPAAARIAEALTLQRDGLSNRQIAARLGVHPTTVGRWLAQPSASTNRITSETTSITSDEPERDEEKHP